MMQGENILQMSDKWMANESPGCCKWVTSDWEANDEEKVARLCRQLRTEWKTGDNRRQSDAKRLGSKWRTTADVWGTSSLYYERVTRWGVARGVRVNDLYVSNESWMGDKWVMNEWWKTSGKRVTSEWKLGTSTWQASGFQIVKEWQASKWGIDVEHT